MKKLIILVLTLVLASIAAGCSGLGGGSNDDTELMSAAELIEMAAKNTSTGSGSGSNTVTGTPNFTVPAAGFDVNKEVTLTFYHTMGANLREELEDAILAFNELYPNITIEHEQVGSYDDVREQISTELTVGNQPNIAYCYPDHVALYNVAGAVVTLDNLIDSTQTVTRADGSTEVLGLTAEQKADFIQGYYNEGRQFGDGLMYSMPLSKSTEVLYYNKTFFEENNLEVPTHWFSTGENDTTSLEYVCEQIKELDETSIPLGYDSEANLFITMCEQLGSEYTSATGDHFLFNNVANKSFCNIFRSWYNEGLMTTQELYGAYTSGLFVNQDPQLPKSYMSIGSSAGATHQRPAAVDGEYPFEVGIAPIPQMNPNNPKVISQGPSLCIFGGDDDEVLASWLFVKFLTTDVEFQAAFSMASGYVPVLKSVGENEIYKSEFLDKANGSTYIAALSVKVCLEQEAAYYTSPAFNGSSVARDQVGQLLTKVISATADDPLAMINESFEDAISECEFYS